MMISESILGNYKLGRINLPIRQIMNESVIQTKYKGAWGVLGLLFLINLFNF